MNGIKKLIMLTFILISYLLVACNQSVEFTIYFDSNGGSEVTSIKTGGSSAIIIPVNPTKDGYYFAGWYWDNNSFNRPFTANSLLEEPISNNMTVYAKWSSNEGDLLGIVTAIGFEIDGTTLYMEVPNSTTSYSFIGQITVSYSATWDLYNDISAVNKIASKTVILSPGDNTIYILVTGTEIKLYTVIIRRLPLCEVSFDVDGGSSIEPQYIQEGDFLEEPYTTKQGYTLVGWQTAYGSTITFPIKIEYDGLIIAVWQSNQSTLSFDANGGEGEMSSIILETNENINLPKNTFTKDGYMFIGWSESTEGNCTYQDEANYEIGILTSYILYAKWEKASTDGIVFTLKDDDTYEVTDYDGSSTTEIIIQNKYKDKAVTSIGASAFIDQMGYSKVISIHIPDSVTSIGEKAFYGRIKLESVTIPEGVISIGKSAFSGCTSLTNVVIPKSVISIGEGAFSGCSSLIEITLPFVGASRTATNSSALFGYIFGTNSYTGGDSVKQYYTSSSSSTYFIPTTLRTVIITDTTTLGCGAFYNCSNLTNITIPENVTIINENVFYSCSGLTSITIPESITSIGTMAFSFCRSLTSITVPKSVTHIGDSAFQGCSNLIEMTLPFIGASRIAGSGQTSSLFGYIFGEFYYTGGVSTRQYYDSAPYCYETYYIPATLKTVIITDATLLGYGAFCYCSNLTSIIIPESVTTVSNKVFFCCTELTIYAQASSKPSGWDSKWNEYTRSVIWGYTSE